MSEYASVHPFIRAPLRSREGERLRHFRFDAALLDWTYLTFHYWMSDIKYPCIEIAYYKAFTVMCMVTYEEVVSLHIHLYQTTKNKTYYQKGNVSRKTHYIFPYTGL